METFLFWAFVTIGSLAMAAILGDPGILYHAFRGGDPDDCDVLTRDGWQHVRRHGKGRPRP